MTTAEQVQQEIIDWANSDSVQDVFASAGWSRVQSFSDACRYFHEYLDTNETDADSGVSIPSGHCLRVEESEEGSKLVTVFSIEAPAAEKKFYRFSGRLTRDETYWDGATIREVFPKVVTTTKFVENPS